MTENNSSHKCNNIKYSTNISLIVLNKLKCNIIPYMNIYLYVDCVINPLVTCIIIIFTLNIIFLHSKHS